VYSQKRIRDPNFMMWLTLLLLVFFHVRQTNVCTGRHTKPDPSRFEHKYQGITAKLLAESNIFQTNGNTDHFIFKKLGHRMLAPTENFYSWFNSGDNMSKVICLDCSLGDAYCGLYLISDIMSTTIKTLNLAFIRYQG
jgi:hypothetical protein